MWTCKASKYMRNYSKWKDQHLPFISVSNKKTQFYIIVNDIYPGSRKFLDNRGTLVKYFKTKRVYTASDSGGVPV